MRGTHLKIHLAVSQQQNTPTLMYNFAAKKYIFAVCHHSSALYVHWLPFCARATKLNIPVSKHFGKLHAPIGIATTSKSDEIFHYLSFCRNHH